jgi:hypothetical protein
LISSQQNLLANDRSCKTTIGQKVPKFLFSNKILLLLSILRITHFLRNQFSTFWIPEIHPTHYNQTNTINPLNTKNLNPYSKCRLKHKESNYNLLYYEHDNSECETQRERVNYLWGVVDHIGCIAYPLPRPSISAASNGVVALLAPLSKTPTHINRISNKFGVLK